MAGSQVGGRDQLPKPLLQYVHERSTSTSTSSVGSTTTDCKSSTSGTSAGSTTTDSTTIGFEVF
jgi:hypothetical protein